GFHVTGVQTCALPIYAGGTYDDGEAVRSTVIEGGFAVSELCATPLSGTETCGLTQLDILYIRPEPDAFIRVNGAGTLYREARIRSEEHTSELQSRENL